MRSSRALQRALELICTVLDPVTPARNVRSSFATRRQRCSPRSWEGRGRYLQSAACSSCPLLVGRLSVTTIVIHSTRVPARGVPLTLPPALHTTGAKDAATGPPAPVTETPASPIAAAKSHRLSSFIGSALLRGSFEGSETQRLVIGSPGSWSLSLPCLVKAVGSGVSSVSVEDCHVPRTAKFEKLGAVSRGA